MLANNTQDQDCAPLSQKDLNPILAAHERFAAYQGGKRAQLTRKGLDGLNLANRVLSEADFTGSSFVGATLYGSNLQRATSPMMPSFRPSSASQALRAALWRTGYLSGGMKLAASWCVACQIHICAKVWCVR